jgi:hypothetical protein
MKAADCPQTVNALLTGLPNANKDTTGEGNAQLSSYLCSA